jgi:hypothetical protein
VGSSKKSKQTGQEVQSWHNEVFVAVAAVEMECFDFALLLLPGSKHDTLRNNACSLAHPPA